MIEVKAVLLGAIENNCYLLTDKETGLSALIDCTEDSDKMLDFIGDSNLQYILLTHGHFDHIGGVAKISEKYSAKVVISEKDAPMLSSSKLSLGAFCGYSQENSKADILVKNNDVIELGKTKIKVMETPGHTKGGVCYIADDAIFSGDTLFYCSCGRTDFPGGSFDEIKESLQKLSNLKGDYKIYPGHNRVTTLDFERKNNPYMNN